MPVSLRAAVPEVALQLGLLALAAAVLWLSSWLWLDAARSAAPARATVGPA